MLLTKLKCTEEWDWTQVCFVYMCVSLTQSQARTHTHTHTLTSTCNLASIELKPQGNAILPGLRSDPNKASQHWLWDSVQNHFSRVCVGVKNLEWNSKKSRLVSVGLFVSLAHVFSFSLSHPLTSTKQRQPKHGSNVTTPAVDVC